MVVAAFVAPFLLPATARFVATAAKLPDVSLAVITAEPAERLPPELKQHLDGHWRVDDPLDLRQLAEAVRGLSQQLGPVERLVGPSSSCKCLWRTSVSSSASTAWTRKRLSTYATSPA